MFIKNITIIVILSTILGCAHNPSAGERMLKHSESTKALGQQWIDSHESIIEAQKYRKKGEAQIKKGYNEIKKGQKLVSGGEKKVTAGRLLVENSMRIIKDGEILKESSETKFYKYESPT